MDKATVLLQRLYQQHGDMQGDVEDRLLEAEVRNLKIGDGPDGPIFGYQIVTRGTATQVKINAISLHLRDMGLSLCTMA